MPRRLLALGVCAMILWSAPAARAGEPSAWGGDNGEWGAAPARQSVWPSESKPGCAAEGKPGCATVCADQAQPAVYPPMLGDQGGFGGFGQFSGGFGQFGGGFGQFGGGFGQFGGGFNVGGGSQFGGGLGQFSGGGFNIGGGGGQFGGGGFNIQGGGLGQFGGGGFNIGGGGGQFGGGGFNAGGFGFAPISVFRGAYKIAENESPKPQNRISFAYNFYDNVQDVAEVHRETPSFEAALFDGRASVGLRVPAIQVDPDTGDGGYGDFADLTIPVKYAIIDGRETGNVLSVGLAVTLPTGPRPTGIILEEDGTLRELHPTLFQPFVGYYWHRDAFFIQGFTSVMAPDDGDDVTALFNDVAVGYRIRGRGIVTEVVPTFETHVTTPLTQRSEDDVPRYRDAVNLTTGATLILGNRVSVAGGVVVPVTGPHLFDLEALANLNIYF